MEKIKAGENIKTSLKERKELKEKLEKEFERILFNVLPFDKKDDNFTKTPHRLAKMWVHEVFNGSFEEPPKCTSFHNSSELDQIVVLGPMRMKSMCAHHFMPFFGNVYFAYKINDKLIGASKPERMLDWISRRPQTQEVLLDTFVSEMQKVLKNEDVMAVALDVQHTCMTHRGVNAHNTKMMNSIVKGIFKNELSAKQEVFDIINMTTK